MTESFVSSLSKIVVFCIAPSHVVGFVDGYFPAKHSRYSPKEKALSECCTKCLIMLVANQGF
jgi:hypothetical protein